ncbi:hypothetical protein BCR44DRAFT_41185 [Catenaria anguillulae PL171]|uniref:ABC transporter domain-containing protein n=1 Tax=Catenaria anguillulae PL171 TaxID=765915 RepID=A0A1Y2HCT3_9FUNG|nr:hypothetical protein BCR44DRAFT_41185 [Catenaria anguillulae PL171]
MQAEKIGARATATARYSVRSTPSFARQVSAILRKSLITRMRAPLPLLINLLYTGFVLMLLWLTSISFNSLAKQSKVNNFPKLADPADTCQFVPANDCVHLGFTNYSNIDPVLYQLKRVVEESEAPNKVNFRMFGSEPEMTAYYDKFPRALVSAVSFDDVRAVTQLPFDPSEDPNAIKLPAKQASVSYAVFSNVTGRTESPIAGRIATIQAYVEFALINARRAQFALAPLPAPFATSTKSGSTANASAFPYLTWINMEQGRAPMFGIWSGIFLMYFAFDLWNSIFSDIATDKTTGIREALTVQGFSPTAYCLAQFIAHMIVNIPVILVLTLVCVMVPTLYPLADPTFLFFIMFLYLASLVLFGLFLSTFVEDPINGRYLSLFVFAACFCLVFFVGMYKWDISYKDLTWGVTGASEFFMYLLSPVIIARMFAIFNFNETVSRGSSWSSLVDSSKSSQIPFLVVFLLFDTVLYAGLLWWADHVSHGGMPVLFPFSAEYWNASHAAATLDDKEDETAAAVIGGKDDASSSSSRTAVPDGDARYVKMPGFSEIAKNHAEGPAVSLRNVVKVFSTLNRSGQAYIDRAFVKNMTLDIPRGSVVGFVGRNGEGKTTTMRMICGLLNPDEGYINVLGTRLSPISVRHVQSQIGLCSQHNVLWPHLTCLEHLKIMADIRGISIEEGSEGSIDDYLLHLLHDVYLGKRAHARAGTMSGGQKRKLCMAMALVGSPKLILLDEPTANMDVYTRQHAWALIQQARKHSTLILTSHSMEEIECVSDYVAIIKRGEARVVGTPLWIKNKYGAGYRVFVEHDVTPAGSSASLAFQPEKVLDVVREYFGGPSSADLIGVNPTSVTIHIPIPEGQEETTHQDGDVVAADGNESVHKKAARFIKEWHRLNKEHALCAAGISLSVIPLEDVFITLNDKWTIEQEKEDAKEEEDRINSYYQGPKPVSS